MKKRDYWNFSELFGRSIPLHEQDEIIAVGALLMYLNNHEQYSTIVNIADLLKAEANAQGKFAKMLARIEREIPYFSGLFEKLPTLQKLTSPMITQLFYELNNRTQYTKVNELLNETLERLMHDMGYRGGESWTPKIINKLALAILNPEEGTFYDGVAGYGGGLLEAVQHAKENNKTLTLYGQEINNKAWAIAKIRLFISGNENTDIRLGNVLTNPQFIQGNKLQKFSYVFMDAPFSMKLNFYDQLKEDPYHQFFYGLPNRSNGDFAFLSHALASLKNTGRGIFLTSHGTLFRGGREGNIRQNMILSDVIEAVISLPSGLYQHTAIPVSMLVLNKNKKRKSKILFIDASNLMTEDGRSRALTKAAIDKIASIVQTGKQVDEVSELIHSNDLEDGNLNVKRYVLPKKLPIEGYGTVRFNVEAYENSPTIPLNEVADFFRGYNVGSESEASDDGMFQIVRLSDVEDGQINMENVSRYNIKTKARTSMYELEKNDVILSIRGQTLKVAVVPVSEENLLLSQNFIGIRCHPELNPYFLKMFLESPLGQYLLTNRMSGTAIPTLSRKDIERLKIPLLPIDKQKQLVDKYNNEEAKIVQEIARLEKQLKEEKLKAYEKMGLKDTFQLDE